MSATLPADGALTGWAAGLLHGAAWFDGLARDGRTPLPVPVAVGPRGGVRRHRGIAVSFEGLPEREVCVRHGVRVTRPERAVFDEMRRQRSGSEALVVLESAVAGGITSPQRLRAYVAARPRRARRLALVEWALDRVRGFVRSPLEVRVRTIAEEGADWERMEVNVVVEDLHGRRIGEVDTLDLEAGAVIEIDGADHRAADQQTWDVTKEEDLRSLGLEVTRVTHAHTRDPEALVARLRDVRARALFEPPDVRRWRVRPRTEDLETRLERLEALAMRAEEPPHWRAS